MYYSRDNTGHARRSAAYDITKSLGGEWCGQYGLIPGPAHSPQDRSLSIRDGKNGEIIVHSFAGDDWRECRDYLKSLGFSIDGRDTQGEYRTPPQSQTMPPPTNQPDNVDYILKIYNERRPICGSPAQTYFEGRGIRNVDLDGSLGFHPACPRRKQRLPAVVALITDIVTGCPCGLHRTYLKPDGSGKVEDQPDKAMLGRFKGGVVRLSPDEEVTHGLGVSEGIETGLSVMSWGWRPVWAVLSTSGLSAFPVLAGIQSLTVFADHDDNGAGQKAAPQCAERWADTGREAIIRTPRKSGDWNDVLQEVKNG